MYPLLWHPMEGVSAGVTRPYTNLFKLIGEKTIGLLCVCGHTITELYVVSGSRSHNILSRHIYIWLVKGVFQSKELGYTDAV